MSERLTQQNIEKFSVDGFTSPVRLFSYAEATRFRAQLEAIESVVGELKGGRRLKCHLLYKWVSELIRMPQVLDCVEQLLGPDILCWGTDLWVKDAQSKKFVSWHQDSEYWGIDSGALLTAWIALSPATVESGCMRMIPGSHVGPRLSHRDTYHEDNMLTRGQTIYEGIDENQACNITADTGEAVFFSYRIAHASHPNTSDDRRIGVAIRYISPDAKQVKSDWDTASLVRGEDKNGNFLLEPVPTMDFDPVAVEFHRNSNENYRKILYSGTDWQTHRT